MNSVTFEIETRIRILNPLKNKGELYSIFEKKKVAHRYYMEGSDLYLFNPRIKDPFYFLRLRMHDITFSDGSRKKLRVLNEKRMLDEEFKPTRMGVRVAEERIFKPLREIESYSSLIKVKGAREAYKIDNFQLARDSVALCGEFIECGVELGRKDRAMVERYSKKVDGFVEELIKRLNDISIKTKVESRIYPEILKI